MMYYTVICTVNTVLQEFGGGKGDHGLFLTLRGGEGALHLFMMSYYRVCFIPEYTHTHTHSMNTHTWQLLFCGGWQNIFDWKSVIKLHPFWFYCIRELNSVGRTFFKGFFLEFKTAMFEGGPLEWGLGAAEAKTLKPRQKHTDKVP